MNPNSPESSQELDYPPVRVNQSLARLDLNTLIMRSQPRRNGEEATSLDDSTYEVLPLSDSVYGTSDDEGHTASVASTTPDDVSTFSDDEGDDFEREYINEAPQQLEPPAAEAFDAHEVTNGDESTLTDRPYLGDITESARTIRMHEGPSAEGGFVEAAEVVNVFDHVKVSDSRLIGRYGCPEVRFTARATLSESFLPVDDSFRILYVGNIDEWCENEIHSRLGVALYASGPSRSIMVRGQMEPMGPMLESDHCKEIELFEKKGKPTQVQLTLDRTQLTLDTKRADQFVTSAPLPDIVVFWYPSTALPDKLVDKYPVLRKALEGYQIPCLDIALAWRCGSYDRASTGDMKSLRLCVEGKKDQGSDFEHQEVIPVDFYTFASLDPSQLNRHLAALTPRSKGTDISKSNAQSKAWNIRSLVHQNLKKAPISRLHSFTATTKLVLSFVALTGMVVLYLLSAVYLPSPKFMDPKPEVQSPLPTALTLSSSVSASTTVASQPAVSLTPSPLFKITPRDLTIVPPPQQPSQRHRERKREEKMGGFEIQATGEHQFLLRPSQDFISGKRKPQLQIQVLRDAKSVPIRYVRTAGGIYVVDLEQEYPLGSFSVSIATHSKPLMQQSFEISMGRNKSMLAQLIDVVKHDVATTQQGLRDLSSTLSKRVQAGFAEMGDAKCGWKHKIRHSRQDMASHFEEAKKEAKRKWAASTTLLREVSGGTWMGLRKATAPVRTSNAALRARNNAFRIRCGLERVVGLSSKDKEEKKTRSCKMVGW